MKYRTTLNILNLPPAAKSAILGQTHHPSSVARIREIEAPRAAAADMPEHAKQVWTLHYLAFVIEQLPL